MRRHLHAVGMTLACVTLTACAARDAACRVVQRVSEQQDERLDDQPGGGPPSGTGQAAASSLFTIAILGDAVTAGIGLRTEDAYPALLQRKFAADGYDNVEVLNAAVVGETTAGGVRRISEIFQPSLRVLVIALGSNDALRGVSAAETGDNLSILIETAIEKHVIVLLAGMDPPSNLGRDYQRAFRGAFARVSSDYRDIIAYMPSLLDGVAGNPALNQDDGIRPNAEGAKVIAQNLYARLQVIVDSLGGGGR